MSEPERRYKYVQAVLAHFWSRWNKEYLTLLREYERVKKGKRNKNFPEENNIVIVYEDKMPRQRWRLGRIVQLIKSRDGAVRAAKVIIGRSRIILERPVSKLYPIEKVEKHEHIKRDTVQSGINKVERTRRNAAVVGELRRRLVSE